VSEKENMGKGEIEQFPVNNKGTERINSILILLTKEGFRTEIRQSCLLAIGMA
jgi:hypothetical protein